MGSRARAFAKLTPPTLPVVLKRPRLFRLLDKSRTRPLTWITAPPGAGKTTLVASYLKPRRLPVLWYRLDESDADPSSFFHYLSITAKVLAPRYRKPLPILTPEYALGLPTFARRYFQELCTRLPRRCVLVLDNYQDVPATAALHQLLAAVVPELPRHVSMMVMSRQPPPPEMAKLEIDRAIAVVDPAKLELSKAEARAIVRLHQRQRPGRSIKANVDELYRRMGGWAAGIVLLLEHARDRNSAVSAPVEKTPEAVFQYLGSEVMERLAPEVQSLLLKTSVLSDISVPMAERLTNLAKAGEILSSLHAARYFTERREGPELWYRYHPLFRDFLLQRARQVFSSEELGLLRRTAAGLLIAAGRIEDGVALLQAAEDWGGLSRVILGQTEDLVTQGRIQTLEHWIRSVPDLVRKEIPWLTFWLATTRVSFNPDEAYELFDQVFEQFRAQGDAAGMLLSWCGAVRAVLIRWAGMKRLDRLLELFPIVHAAGTPYPSIAVEAHVADCMAGAVMQRQPYRDDAKAWIDRAVHLSDHLPPAVQTGSRYMIEIYYLWLGDCSAARKGLAQFSRLAHSQRWSPFTTIFFHATSATLAWFGSECDLCRTHVAKAKNLIDQSGLHVWDGLLLSQGVAGELIAGNLVAAEALLKEEDVATERLSGIHRAHYLHLLSWFELVKENFQQAWEHIQHSLDLLAAEDGHPFAEGMDGLIAVQALHELGREQEAMRWLSLVVEIGEKMRSDLIRFGGCLVNAQISFERGKECEGLDALRKGLAIGNARGLMVYPAIRRGPTAKLCAKALGAGIMVPFVQQMIRKHRFTPPPEARGIEAWPWPVKIRTLGSLSIEIDGKPLEKHRKAPHRLFELLAAIIAFGGQEVPVTQLADILWPEIDGDQAQENFKKSITRLRHLLNIDDVIQWQEGKVSLNRDRCWVDALAFEAGAKQAEERTAASTSNSHADHAARASALYTGPFLGLEGCPPWARSYRDRLRDRYIKLIVRQCERSNTKRKTTDVVRCLEQALEVDPLAEPLYQRLIPLLAANGRQTAAASWYHRCKSALARWDARQPSFETQQLLKTLQLS